MIDLVERLAQALYDLHTAGADRHEAPAWLVVDDAVRQHWRGLAQAALAMVRRADEDLDSLAKGVIT